MLLQHLHISEKPLSSRKESFHRNKLFFSGKYQVRALLMYLRISWQSPSSTIPVNMFKILICHSVTCRPFSSWAWPLALLLAVMVSSDLAATFTWSPGMAPELAQTKAMSISKWTSICTYTTSSLTIVDTLSFLWESKSETNTTHSLPDVYTRDERFDSGDPVRSYTMLDNISDKLSRMRYSKPLPSTKVWDHLHQQQRYSGQHEHCRFVCIGSDTGLPNPCRSDKKRWHWSDFQDKSHIVSWELIKHWL